MAARLRRMYRKLLFGKWPRPPGKFISPVSSASSLGYLVPRFVETSLANERVLSIPNEPYNFFAVFFDSLDFFHRKAAKFMFWRDCYVFTELIQREENRSWGCSKRVPRINPAVIQIKSPQPSEELTYSSLEFYLPDRALYSSERRRNRRKRG